MSDTITVDPPSPDEALEAQVQRLRLAVRIAKHQLPPPSRRGAAQRDLAMAIRRCEAAGDLDGPVSWGDEEAGYDE